MNNNFKQLQISENIISALTKQSITTPTEIQSNTIPLLIDNQDVIAQAITGSGKTLSYVLPSFEKIDTSSKELHTLILAPTHELVIQINNVIKNLSKASNSEIRSTIILGDVNIRRQLESLKSKPHIIIGTSGRVLELIKLRKIKAHQIKTIILDEGDKLLSDNYIDTTKQIIKTTLKQRQICIFSASLSDKIIERAESIMNNPTLVQLNKNTINPNITHYCILSEQRDKIDNLRKSIHALKPKKAIVFINKNELVQEVEMKLNYHKINCVSIFGNIKKSERKAALDSFKFGKSNILISSDLSARGLDLEDITHIFNLDIPEDIKEYVHRAGRTARANKKGVSLSIITEHEIPTLMKIENLYNIEFDVKAISYGKLVEPKKK